MPMYKKSLTALLFIALAVIGGTIYGNATSDDIPKLDKAAHLTKVNEDDEMDNSEGKTIFVYVTGAVNKPGMVELVADKTLRAVDAVNECGGLLPTADVDNFNMAETISDGQHIRVPEKTIQQSAQSQVNNYNANDSSDGVSASPSNNSSSKTVDSGGMVNINTANSTELQTLKGIGPKMAERIIEYRQNNGSFKSIEEIKNVRGIGDKTFEKLKNRLKI